MSISYTKVGDYLLPDLKLEDKERFNIGKYGLLKLEYLKKNKRGLYTELLMKDKLNKYLHDIDITVMEKVQKLIKELTEKENINEELKQNNQILWVSEMNNIKNMVDNGNISDAISQISPEMIQNFSKMFAGQNSNSDTNNNNSNQVSNNENINYNEKNSSNTHSENTDGLNLNGLDMNTIMKMSSAFGKMNSKNDPRANLLNSLQPYLRDSKKSQLDNCMNLLNVSKIAELMKKSENSKNNNN